MRERFSLAIQCGGHAALRKALACIWAALTLAACGDNRSGAPVPTVKQWNDLNVQVQTQPDPPRAGANEVLVILAAPRGIPTYDSIVWLRASEEDPWVQAIQDGHSGVYRRVVRLESPGRSVLQVRISRQNDQTVLTFPLLSAAS